MNKEEKTATNMGFSAMLAEEYNFNFSWQLPSLLELSEKKSPACGIHIQKTSTPKIRRPFTI